MVLPYMSDVKLGCSDGRDSCNCTHEMAAFGDRVDYHHDRVLSVGIREFHDEINTYGIPWCAGNRERMQFPRWRLFDCFGTETHVTGGDILAYVSRHLWPPIIPGYQLQSFPSSGVSGYLGVMAESYNFPAKICFWDIDFLCNVIVCFPLTTRRILLILPGIV